MKNLVERVLEYIDSAEVTTFLQQLIQAPSVFPPGNTVEVAQVCFDKMSKAGIEVRKLALDAQLPSVLGFLGNGKGPTLVFHSHIDTVPTGDVSRWRLPPFSGAITDGMVYGRGAGDCKGSTAAQVMAALALARAGASISGTLIVACVADEESDSSFGTKWLREAGHLKPDYIVIGEQTNNEIAIAERGLIWIKLTVEGKAAHGAMPSEGESAIFRMGAVLQEIADCLLPELSKRTHPLLAGSTLNVGIINGGIKTNIVPEICSIEIDRRVLPSESSRTVLEDLESIVAGVKRRIGSFPHRFEVIRDWAPSVNTSPTDPFVQKVQMTLTQVKGYSPPLAGYRQGSDGRFFAKDGIPIVIFGPSDPAVGHHVDEACSIQQLVEATKVLAVTAMNVLR